MTETYRRLYERLRSSEFGCIPAGFQETEDIYQLVKEEYPDLCDDSIQCREVCGTDKNQPEWKHRVRTVQQDLLQKGSSRIKRYSKGWYYEPETVDIKPSPSNSEGFQVGAKYNRWELHDIFGGQRYRGIATPSDHPYVFIFTGDSGQDFGYEDEFLPDDTFLYTGEGTEGDMKMEGGNKAIRDHHQEGEEIHLFEDTEFPWIVSYIGQFEYVRHQRDTLEDQQGDQRSGIRFKLQPVGGTGIEVEEGAPSNLPLPNLFQKAKESSPTEKGDEQTRTTTSSRRTYARSEVVKEFALQVADGECRGCGEEAPFMDTSGDPYLEVHHLHRRSDGGPDDPENVVALCPNCHQRVHKGMNGAQFNRELIKKVEERNRWYTP